MIAHLVLAAAAAAALVGQQQAVYLGHVDPDGRHRSVAVATNETVYRLFVAEAAGRSSPDFAQPTGIAGVAFGTQVRVVKPAVTYKWVDGRSVTTPGYQVEILEGPLEGRYVVTSVAATYRAPARELAVAPPIAAVQRPPVKVWLGASTPGIARMGAVVAASAAELGERTIVKFDAVRQYNVIDAPVMVAQVGYGVRAEARGIVDYTSEGKPRKAGVVKLLDGPGAGKTVFVDASAVHLIESAEVQSASASASASDQPSGTARTAAKQRARRSAMVAAGRAREAAEAAQVAKAEAEYRKMLPFLLERERVLFERANAMERTAILQRFARSAERSAGAAEYSAGMPRSVLPNGAVGAVGN